MSHPSASSRGTWGLLLLAALLIVAFGFSILYPYPVNVTIDPEPTPLRCYDDGAGHSPLLAELRVTNVSKRMWFVGTREMPYLTFQQLVDGKWEFSMSSSEYNGLSTSKVWTALKSGESITVSAGPVSEAAAQMRVGLAFTTEKITPNKVHWIHSPIAKLVKRGEDYIWQPVDGALQEEQVLRWR
jgi:hypothetical protein